MRLCQSVCKVRLPVWLLFIYLYACFALLCFCIALHSCVKLFCFVSFCFALPCLACLFVCFVVICLVFFGAVSCASVPGKYAIIPSPHRFPFSFIRSSPCVSGCDTLARWDLLDCTLQHFGSMHQHFGGRPITSLSLSLHWSKELVQENLSDEPLMTLLRIEPMKTKGYLISMRSMGWLAKPLQWHTRQGNRQVLQKKRSNINVKQLNDSTIASNEHPSIGASRW